MGSTLCWFDVKAGLSPLQESDAVPWAMDLPHSPGSKFSQPSRQAASGDKFQDVDLSGEDPKASLLAWIRQETRKEFREALQGQNPRNTGF